MSRRSTPPRSAANKDKTKSSSSQAARQKSGWRIGLLPIVGAGAIIFIVGGIGLALYSRSKTPSALQYVTGNVVYCNNALPAFAQSLGFSSRALLDTQSLDVKGIALVDVDEKGKYLRSYQHPSWSAAGYLGPPVLDRVKNIYVAPVPAINILDNPPAKANIIYEIDSVKATMSPYIELPAAAPSTPENVYGILGLSYDCDTNSLYASSVFGSTRFTQAGRLYRIDLNSRQIGSQVDGIDVFGLAVFNGSQGKRLYFGLARAPEVYSISLDDQGNFAGSMRLELSLTGVGFHGDERARLIKFSGKESMVVQTMQFDFNLVASTEIRQTRLEYRYDAANDKWQLVNSTPVN